MYYLVLGQRSRSIYYIKVIEIASILLISFVCLVSHPFSPDFQEDHLEVGQDKVAIDLPNRRVFKSYLCVAAPLAQF